MVEGIKLEGVPEKGVTEVRPIGKISITSDIYPKKYLQDFGQKCGYAKIFDGVKNKLEGIFAKCRF